MCSVVKQVIFAIILFCNHCYGLKCKKKDIALGQQQLVEILNAAWVRVLYNGEYRNIIETNNVDNVTVDIADCLPIPELAPFPDVSSLKCKSADIITSSNILKFGVIPDLSNQDLSGIATTGYFKNTIPNIRNGIVNEINLNYNINIDIQIVDVFPFQGFTHLLNDGSIDILDQSNALGGKDENDNLRRYVRLFTCILIGSGQFVMVPTCSSITRINDIIDLGENARLCASQLSTQLTNAYFPAANVTTVGAPPFGNGDIQ